MLCSKTICLCVNLLNVKELCEKGRLKFGGLGFL